jgi:hypothetical protein
MLRSLTAIRADFNNRLGSHATPQNADLLIDLNVDGQYPNVDTILLKNVTLAVLHINDFILNPGGPVAEPAIRSAATFS